MRPISTMTINKMLERKQREAESIFILMLGYKLWLEARERRIKRFKACMGLVGDSLVTSRHEGRRILSVNPRPHPNDEARPLATNWPQPGKRVMPGSHYARMKFSHGVAR